MAKFQVIRRANGEFSFSLKANNGRTLLTSESYTSIHGVENAISQVKRIINDQRSYVMGVSGTGKYYFLLVAPNGQILGQSEMFESEANREVLIKTLMLFSDFETILPSEIGHNH